MSPTSTAPTQQTESEALRTRITTKLEEDALDLPLLPVVATQVLHLSDDPNADATKLSALIQQDQALAAQILRIANSPAYAARSSIVSLQQAISWLGLNILAGLAFSVSVQSGVFKVKGYEKEVHALWRQALATGLYGKEIARRNRHNVENAFLCGILHTIGKPLLIHLMLQDSGDTSSKPSWTTMNSIIQECSILAGTKLAAAWQLPESVQEAIQFYPDESYYQATSPTKGAIITCLADHLATRIVDPSYLDEDTIRGLAVVQDLNFYPDDMDALFDLKDTIQQSVESFLT